MKRRTFFHLSALTAGALFLPAPWLVQGATREDLAQRIQEELRNLHMGADDCPAHHALESCIGDPNVSLLECSSIVEVEHVDVDVPPAFTLAQNYPNPFNPSTTIAFMLAEDSTVDLRVYNMTGQRVATLVGGRLPAGCHQVRWEVVGLDKGTYQYVLEAGPFLQSRRMILLS